jgi:hypothetical protein
MFQRKQRRFRSRSNGRNQRQHGHSHGHIQRNNSFSNGYNISNNFRSTQSAEKLLEKYNNLAKEAISSGDKTLGENYLQHADHFMRIIEDKNKNKDQGKNNIIEKTGTETTRTPDNNKINQEDVLKNKE